MFRSDEGGANRGREPYLVVGCGANTSTRSWKKGREVGGPSDATPGILVRR